jgi:hypothetical protein
MATQEKSYEFIIYFLLLAVILNIVLFIAASMQWTNSDLSPQIIGATLFGSLLLLGIILGISMIFKITENNYLKLISAVVLILGLSIFFGIIQAKFVVAMITIIFLLIMCIVGGYITMRLFGVWPSNQSPKKPSNPYIPPIYNPPKIKPPPKPSPKPIPQPRPEREPQPRPIQPKLTQQNYEMIGKIRNRTLKDLGWSEFFNYIYDDSILGKMTKAEFHEIEMRLQYKKDQKEKEERQKQQNNPQPSQQNIVPSQKPQKNNIPEQPKNLPKITIEDIDKMGGTEFEKFLKILFENMEYSVELTQHTTDMGADLILSKSGEKISVQAKRWSANVGNDAIQAVVGSLKVYKTQKGMVVTNSYFTNPAIYQAHHNNVELWNRDILIEMITKYPVGK